MGRHVVWTNSGLRKIIWQVKIKTWVPKLTKFISKRHATVVTRFVSLHKDGITLAYRGLNVYLHIFRTSTIRIYISVLFTLQLD
jgi:hypothetical protein